MRVRLTLQIMSSKRGATLARETALCGCWQRAKSAADCQENKCVYRAGESAAENAVRDLRPECL